MRFPLTRERTQYFISEKVVKTDGIATYQYDTIPAAAAQALEKAFSVGEIYVLTLQSVGGFLGLAAAVMRKGDPAPGVTTLDGVANAASAALQRLQAEEKARENEMKFRTLAEKSLQGILIANRDRVAFANHRIGEMTGYEPDELIGLTPDEIIHLLIDPRDRDLLLKNFDKRLKDYPVSPCYKFRILRKGGAACIVEMSATLIDIDGRPAIQAVFVDAPGRTGEDA
jgi:PAS domain S-box-containing protein